MSVYERTLKRYKRARFLNRGALVFGLVMCLLNALYHAWLFLGLSSLCVGLSLYTLIYVLETRLRMFLRSAQPLPAIRIVVQIDVPLSLN